MRRMSTQGEGKTEKGKGKGESKKRGPHAHETQNEFNESLKLLIVTRPPQPRGEIIQMSVVLSTYGSPG